jgi:hypothetical protein
MLMIVKDDHVGLVNGVIWAIGAMSALVMMVIDTVARIVEAIKPI